MAFSINVASVMGSFKVVPRHAQLIDLLSNSVWVIPTDVIPKITIVINKAILTSILTKNIRPNNISINGYFAWLAWLAVHLVFLMGMRNRISVFLNWAWSYLAWRQGARIITKKLIGRSDGSTATSPNWWLFWFLEFCAKLIPGGCITSWL